MVSPETDSGFVDSETSIVSPFTQTPEHQLSHVRYSSLPFSQAWDILRIQESVVAQKQMSIVSVSAHPHFNPNDGSCSCHTNRGQERLQEQECLTEDHSVH